MSTPLLPQAILFDLDGTLVDSAHDLVATTNRLRTYKNLAPLPFDALRNYSTSGVRGLLKAAFNLDPSQPDFADYRQLFLEDYARNIANHTVLFDGVLDLFTQLHTRNFLLGIVTNKIESLTLKLLAEIHLPHVSCVIGGDTTSASKPSPLPLYEAAKRLSLNPVDCWYVGDDPRDAEAAKNAGMDFVAVDYGYGAMRAVPCDKRINSPMDLLAYLGHS